MEIYLGNELGNLSEQDCKAIKSIMDGMSYYRFNVGWSNYAGNCQLIVKTDYPDADEDAVRSMFLHCLSIKSANMAARKKMLEDFCRSKYEHPDGLVMFEGKHIFSFYFKDAEIVASIMPEDKLTVGHTVPENYPFANIRKTNENELLSRLAEKRIGCYMYKMLSEC